MVFTIRIFGRGLKGGTTNCGVIVNLAGLEWSRISGHDEPALLFRPNPWSACRLLVTYAGRYFELWNGFVEPPARWLKRLDQD